MKKKTFSINADLMKGLEETVAVAQNYSNIGRIEVLPLTKIELDPENPRELILTMDDLYQGFSEQDIDYDRKTKEKTGLQTLVHSIREEGIQNPVIVYKHFEKYRLIAGERRVLGSIIAGKEHIQAKILDRRPNAYRLSYLQWIENIEREDLSLWEKIRNLQKMLEAYSQEKNIIKEKITPSILASLIGCSPALAVNYLSVLNTQNTRLISLLQQDTIRNLEKAAIIGGAEEEMQDALIESCIKGANVKELRQISNFNSQAKKAPAVKQNKSRGPKTEKISLGQTNNPTVARIVLEALLENHRFAFYKNLGGTADWDDAKSITKLFKQIIFQLEKSIN